MTQPDFGTPRRARLLGIALLVAMFVVGGFTGFSFNHVLEAREPSAGEARSCAATAGKHDSSILDRLDLTAEQQQRIEAILERKRGQVEMFWDGEGARLRTLVHATRAEIREVLTPAQRAEYDRLRAEQKAWHEAQKAEDREDER